MLFNGLTTLQNSISIFFFRHEQQSIIRGCVFCYIAQCKSGQVNDLVLSVVTVHDYYKFFLSIFSLVCIVCNRTTAQHFCSYVPRFCRQQKRQQLNLEIAGILIIARRFQMGGGIFMDPFRRTIPQFLWSFDEFFHC